MVCGALRDAPTLAVAEVTDAGAIGAALIPLFEIVLQLAYGHSACQPIVCFIPSPGIILIIPGPGRLWHDDAAKNDGRHEGKK